MTTRPRKLGEMLLQAGIIDRFQLESALSRQRNLGGRLGASLLHLGYITEEKLLGFLAEQLNCPRPDLSRLKIPANVLEYIPAGKARQFNALPVERRDVAGASCLLVAMCDPTDLEIIDSLQFMTGCRIRPAIGSRAAIQEAIARNYGPAPDEGLPELEPLAEHEFDLPILRRDEKTTEEKFQALLDKLYTLGILTGQEVEELR